MKTLLELNPKVGDKVKWTGSGREEVYEVLEVQDDRYYLNHDGYHFWWTDSEWECPQWSLVVDQKPKTFGELSDEEKSELVLARHVRGEDIELWMSEDYWLLLPKPEWYSYSSYRIKPKDPVVETVTMHGVNGRFSSAYICRNDTHKITYNTIDGVIDCSSVKMEEL